MTRKEAIEILRHLPINIGRQPGKHLIQEAMNMAIEALKKQPEQDDYTEMKREFIRMAEYIDVLLKVSDEQKETLIGFISRLAEFMPWTERD